MKIDLAKVLRPGDGVIWGQSTGEPQALVEAFVEQRAAYRGATAFLGISYSGIVRPEHADVLRFSSYAGTGTNRALTAAGVLEIHPHPYSRFGALIRAGRLRADVVFVQVSPPNARGEHSLGLSHEYLLPALEGARAIVVEINDQVPWVHGERTLKAADFALSIETSRAPIEAPAAKVGEIERAIATHAAAFIPDGATLEFGLGALPDAVLAALADRKDLGVHSGALGDSLIALIERGVVTNARKPIDAGRVVGGVLMGSRRLFDFAHENAVFHLRSSDYTHAGATLGRLPKFVAINSAVEVDLTGQVNAEVANGAYVGAVGGALDFIRAANASAGGVSLICLPAAVGTKASRIVATLSGPVATPRSEAGVFVTEHGAADLRGLTLRERAKRMLAIAAPAFREPLEREARAQGLLG
ncbi:MAG TPA: acetyl-CoA hydrolase/transferase C-terminal domain-containing protein [Burkholderiales bacterium]